MIFAVTLVFATSLFGEFLNYDDPELLTQHPFFQEVSLSNMLSFWNIEAFFNGILLDYSPLRDISYMFDRVLWGWNSVGFHFTQVLLHVGNTALVYMLIAFYLPASRVWPLLGALFWALHPVQVEPVAWISSRKDVLMGLFFFSALWFYQRQKNISASVMTVCAVLSKYTALSLVPIFGGLSLREKRRQGFILGLALFAGAFASVVVLGNKHADKLVSEPGLSWAMFDVPLWIFKTLVAPFWLSARYVQRGAIDAASLGLSLTLLIVFLGVFIKTYRQKDRPMGFVGLVIFVGALLPLAAQIILGHPIWMADRYLYVPLLGVTLWLVDGLSRARQQKIAQGGAGLILLVAIVLNVQRQSVWKNSVALWEDTVVKSPALYYVQGNMGAAYLEAGEIQKALAPLKSAIVLNRSFGKGHLDLAVAFLKMGQKANAVDHFKTSENLLSEVDKKKYLGERGLALALLGDPKNGEALMLEYLSVFKNDAPMWSNLGSLYANYNMGDRALKAWSEALRVNPLHKPTRQNRLKFYLHHHRCAEAQVDVAFFDEFQAEYTLRCAP